MEPDGVREAMLLIESFLKSNPTEKGCTLFVIGYCDILDVRGGRRGGSKTFIAFELGDNIEEKQSYSDINDPFHAIGSGSGIGKLAWRRQIASKTMDDRDSVAMAVKEVLVSACMDDPCCGGLLRLRWVGKRRVDPIGTDEHLIDAMLSTQTPLKKTNILMFSEVSLTTISITIRSGSILKSDDYDCQLKRKPQCLGYVVHEKWTCFLVDVVTKDKKDKSDDYFRKFCQRMRGNDPDYLRLTYIRGVKDSRNKTTKVPVLVARANLEILREAREGKLFA
ncbi:hypothetical protein CASFOL_041973 [Castilleja foliolosa]|uniref:Uncharacterized protein n=1 Tax=Castilleja foliolosa TaxID=1961234 RepID=A0ABD3B9G8_9LAMI